MNSAWPTRLEHGAVGLRPVGRADASTWSRLRRENIAWLSPWDGTLPPVAGKPALSTKQVIASLRRRARHGTTMPFVVTFERDMVGMLTISNINWGSARSSTFGYWIAQSHAGRGIMPTAVAMACDHVFFTARLHRVEIAIRPENVASLRIVEKLGFTRIGLAPSYIHIAGSWRDHLLFQLTADDVSGRVVDRLVVK